MRDDWFPPPPPPADTRLRLVCVPFAGGGAGIYRSWPGVAPAGVHVLPAQLPGRERRLRERAYDAMAPLVHDLLQATRADRQHPWAVFGHSMGGGIAWELAVAAAREGTPPVHLFLSARRAPGSNPTHPPLFALPEPLMIQEVERLYGPFPDVLKQHPGLLQTFLPTMRADLKLLDTWVPTLDVLTDVPITVYGGVDDLAVPAHSLDGWAERTTGPFEKVMVPGGHFMVRDATDVRDHLMRALAPLSAG
jgi:medium-chain acyl-[acyl-carrier-protein] hydrolase